MAVLVIAAAAGASPVVIPAGPLGTTGAKGDPGSPGEGYATRVAMAGRASPALLDDVYLTEAGREGKFVVDAASSWTAAITADTAQGVFVASTADATKVYRRVLNGAANVKWFGAVEDGSTDDHATVSALSSYRQSVKITGFGYSSSLPKALIPFGVSNQGTTPIDLVGGGILEGECGSIFSGGGSVLEYAPNTSAIRVQFLNTSGDTNYDTSITNSSASGSIIRNLTLKGSNTGTDQTKPGVRLKAPTVLQDVLIDGFAGSGIKSNAQIASPGVSPNSTSAYGNAALSQIHRCTIQNCFNGVELQGADSSICTVAFSSANNNRGYGYYDNTEFGCLWLGLHAALNTLGNYHTDPSQAAAHPTIVGCYSESGSPGCTFSSGTLRLGGLWGTSDSGGGYVYAQGDSVHVNTLSVDGNATISGGLVSIGPQIGSPLDSNINMGTTNSFAGISGTFYTSLGAPTAMGKVQFFHGFGNIYDAPSAQSHLFRIAGAEAVVINTNGLGYNTGVGGTVTQATSRTTGVTINKVCGQITLVSAAGSVSWQTFTVTNSTIAATDVIRLNQASGADKYMIHVTHVAAGSFDVTYATTGGTTTEQPVFNFAVLKAVNA